MGNHEWAINTLPLIINERSKFLILGSFPGAESRKECSYYCSPNNRFWKALGYAFGETIYPSDDLSIKRDYLLRHRVAVWDVCACCTIIDSKDRTIKNIVPNPVCCVIKHSNIKKVICNGNKAYELFTNLCEELGVKLRKGFVVELPSTSRRDGWSEKNKSNNNYTEWKKTLEP